MAGALDWAWPPGAQLACNSVPACIVPCSKVMAGEGEDEGLFDRCNGTPAFLAPEMMKPHARYR